MVQKYIKIFKTPYLFQNIFMAKSKGSSVSTKISFGKRKKGKAAKSTNKHNRGEKTYRGQGR